MRLRETALSHADGTNEQRRAFNHAASAVCEAYDLYRPDVETPGTAKIDVEAHDEAPAVRYPTEPPDGRDGDVVDEIHVALPMAQYLAVPAPDRPRRLLDTLHVGVTQLAAARGLPAEPFHVAYERALAAGIRAVWRSPAKHSPDRRLVATVVGEVGPDGGWSRLEVRDKSGAEVAATAPEPLDVPEVGEIRIRAHTIRWSGPRRVEVHARPYPGFDKPAYPPIILDLDA